MKCVNFLIGGQLYTANELRLWAIEQCWPSIEALGENTGSIFYRSKNAIRVFACAVANDPETVPAEWRGLDDNETVSNIVDDVFRRLTKSEMDKFFISYIELLSISGFVPSGEEPATMGNVSAETGAPLSQNSLSSESAAATGNA